MRKDTLLEKLLLNKKDEEDKSYYEHMVESVDTLLFFEKIYLLEYLADSTVTEMDEFLKLDGEKQ